MKNVSLTDFVDFVVKSGTPKQTKVRQIKERDEYDPRFDFWKKLRVSIIDFHKAGLSDKKYFDKVLHGLTDNKKIQRYPEAINGYKKFLGRKKITWFDPPRKIWDIGELPIIINPELGLKINDAKYIIKLYFKDEGLSKAKSIIVLCLMELALRKTMNSQASIAILDVSKSNIFPLPKPLPDIMPLLAGEAASFVTMYNQI